MDSALRTQLDLKSRIQLRLDEFLGERLRQLGDISEDLIPFGEALQSLLRGGKRLRPAFAYWAWRGAGGEDDSRLIDAVTGLEMLQACALIHDDVMDCSDTRRGLPSAHRRFATMHTSEGWNGPPEGFGVSAAILLGDLCLSWADELLFTSGLPSADLMRAKPIYDVMRTELMAGQYLDLLEQSKGGGSVSRGMTVVRYKAAKYTVERPLHLGAALAGAGDQLMASYSAYGLPLGEAFQLRDDVLGVFGDPAQTGKPAGDDLREGKRTVLVALTNERVTPATSAVLEQYLGDPALDASGVDLLRTIISESGALAEVEKMIQTLRSHALEALDHAAVETLAHAALTDLAHAATSRSPVSLLIP